MPKSSAADAATAKSTMMPTTTRQRLVSASRTPRSRTSSGRRNRAGFAVGAAPAMRSPYCQKVALEGTLRFSEFAFQSGLLCVRHHAVDERAIGDLTDEALAHLFAGFEPS